MLTDVVKQHRHV